MADLPDVNVLLAFLNEQSDWHLAANLWLTACEKDGIEVRIAYEVASACIRLAANPKIATPIVPVATTYRAIEKLAEASHVGFVAPDPGSWRAFGLVVERVRGYRQVPDAHLASLARANGYRLVTFDRGLRDFSGLDVEILTT